MSKSTSTLENLKKQTENEKTVACPLCRIAGAKFLCDVDAYRIWRCPSCALDFVFPEPSEEFLQSYYDQEAYFEHCKRGGYEDYDQQTEGVIPTFIELLSQYEAICSGRRILDVGCAYGTHLAVAAERGWQAFGVELSVYAREVAVKRHGNKIRVFEAIEALTQHEFDLILLFDVIEHLADPLRVFFKLFEKGAIGPKTEIAITTPNGRSHDAIENPAKWAFRHPPSHLCFYSAESLRALMRRIQFRKVAVAGLYPTELSQKAAYDDEFSVINQELQAYTGLLCQAAGNDFKDFKRFPKYVFAQGRSKGRRVLDFGCGPGYGSALLADAAKDVLGVDLETDAAAVHWAPQLHSKTNLKFQLRSDLGKGLPSESFDVITCFDTFEHLSETVQCEFLENTRRLLASRGELLISVPNPMIGRAPEKRLGDDGGQFGCHEKMAEGRIKDLLGSYFPHVHILGEWTRPSVLIADEKQTKEAMGHYEWKGSTSTSEMAPPSNYIAVCSKQVVRQPKGLRSFDSSFDPAATELHEAKLHEMRVNSVSLQQLSRGQEQSIAIRKEVIAGQQQAIATQQQAIATQQQAIATQQQAIAGQQQAIVSQQETIRRFEREIAGLHQLVQSKDEELGAIKRSKTYRLTNSIRNEPLSLVKIARIIYLVTGILTPSRVRKKAQPLVARIKTAAAEIQRRRSQTSQTKAASIAANATAGPASQGAETARKELAETATAKRAAKEKLVFEPASLDYAAEEDAYESTDKIQRRPRTASRISHVSLVLFTQNVGPSFSESLRAITAQELGELSLDVTVIDCCSTDSTVGLAREHGIDVIQVNPARFNPGVMRNLAFKKTSGDAVVFLSQDAIPGDTRLIQHLVKPFDDPLVAGVYGRRIPSPNEVASTSPILSARATANSEPKTQFLRDVASYNSLTPAERAQACHFDSVCCALRRTAWQEIPFRATEFGEHLEWSKQVLEAGWKIIYEPASCVMRSRRHSLKHTFKQTYLVHKKLYKLFGVNTVRSRSQLIACTLRCTRRDLVDCYKREPNFLRRISLPAKVFAFSLVAAYAQYRSVRDAQALGNEGRSNRIEGVVDR